MDEKRFSYFSRNDLLWIMKCFAFIRHISNINFSDHHHSANFGNLCKYVENECQFHFCQQHGAIQNIKFALNV